MNQAYDLTKDFVVLKKPVASAAGVNIMPGQVGIIKSREANKLNVFFILPWEEVSLDDVHIEVIDLTKTGDNFENKVCNVCHTLKPSTEFDKNQNGINNRSVRRPSCRDCRKIIDGVSVSSADRKEWNKIKPVNVPFECPVCKKRTIAGVTSKVVLEHSHETGLPGGWICDSCNTGLGRFKDNVELLESAISFLKNSY